MTSTVLPLRPGKLVDMETSTCGIRCEIAARAAARRPPHKPVELLERRDEMANRYCRATRLPQHVSACEFDDLRAKMRRCVRRPHRRPSRMAGIEVAYVAFADWMIGTHLGRGHDGLPSHACSASP